MGRPIAYRGDPNAPELTDQERRRIKRRIANRESARRVRHKRQEELEDMQIKASHLFRFFSPQSSLAYVHLFLLCFESSFSGGQT